MLHTLYHHGCINQDVNESVCKREREKERKNPKRHLHSVVGDYLVSIFEPCDKRSGERSKGRLAYDGCSALSRRLSLLFSGEVPQN